MCNSAFIDAVAGTGGKQILLGGIEAHNCVYQMALSLKSLGYEVQVVAEAVSSRTLPNKEIGLKRIKSEGIALTSVEMAIYELIKIGII